MEAPQVAEIAVLYGETRLIHIQHDFAVAQARLRQQEMLTLSFRRGFNTARDRLREAYEDYRVLSHSIDPPPVSVLTSFVKTVSDMN